MFLTNILSTIGITSFGDGFGAVNLSWEGICKIITWIVNFAGDVGLGIIIFTALLKVITLPFDIISRASMKKNQLKLESMQDDLKKLQKQYANNSQLYQQKMMALYKKNGYSPLSACLPTILTLIIFIIVINAFNSYSKFADKEVFNEMGRAYTQSIVLSSEDGLLVNSNENEYNLNIDRVLQEKGYGSLFNGYTEGGNNTDVSAYAVKFDQITQNTEFLEKYPQVKGFFKDGKYSTLNTELTNQINGDVVIWLVENKAQNVSSLISENVIKKQTISGVDYYSILDAKRFYEEAGAEVQSFMTKEDVKDEEGKVVGQNYLLNYDKILNLSGNESLMETFELRAGAHVASTSIKLISDEFLNQEVYAKARQAAKDAYYEYRSHSVITFWVKNVWVVDSAFSSAIPSYDKFCSAMGNDTANIGSLTEEAYNEITFDLADEKQTGFGKGNGWFILVALSIAIQFLSTYIMNKMQKTQIQLSSVDGENSSAAMSQKMMTWMMPIMFGVFAFIYSASFSIYMITSSVLSLVSTLLINLAVEITFKKKVAKEEAEKANKQKYGKRR